MASGTLTGRFAWPSASLCPSSDSELLHESRESKESVHDNLSLNGGRFAIVVYHGVPHTLSIVFDLNPQCQIEFPRAASAPGFQRLLGPDRKIHYRLVQLGLNIGVRLALGSHATADGPCNRHLKRRRTLASRSPGLKWPGGERVRETDVEMILRANGIGDLILAGIVTRGVVFVGCDIRVDPELPDVTWDLTRRELFLIRPEVARPLSIDPWVWPKPSPVAGEPVGYPLPWVSVEDVRQRWASQEGSDGWVSIAIGAVVEDVSAREVLANGSGRRKARNRKRERARTDRRLRPCRAHLDRNSLQRSGG